MAIDKYYFESYYSYLGAIESYGSEGNELLENALVKQAFLNAKLAEIALKTVVDELLEKQEESEYE